MITRFKAITKPLSAYAEAVLVPTVVQTLRGYVGAESAITNRRLRDLVDDLARSNWTPRIWTEVAPLDKMDPKPVGDVTIRAVIHKIRTDGLVPDLVASSCGYYIAESAEDVIEYAESLRERAESILSIRRSLFIHSKLIPPPLDGGQFALFEEPRI